MIHLYIDGKEAVINADFSFEITKANPFFSKDGNYTLDIDLSLAFEENSRLYSHINHLHANKKISNRKAELYNDFNMIIAGTEVILSVEDNSVKIQIVSDNSELNYIAKSDRLITDLQLGSFNGNHDTAASYNYQTSEQVNCAFPCVQVRFRNVKGVEGFTSVNDPAPWAPGSKWSPVLHQDYGIAPQPYLVNLVEKILENLGYVIDKNFLRDSSNFFSRIIVVNGLSRTNFADMLPEWSIDKFLTEVEKLFNCMFLVDSLTKKVSIVSTAAWYGADRVINYISRSDVLDMVSMDFNSEENLYVSYDNVAYNLPSDDIYKFWAIDSSILQNTRNVTCPTYGSLCYRDTIDKRNIYRTAYCYDFCCCRAIMNNLQGDEEFNVYKQLMAFQPHKTSSEGDTKLEIIPADTIFYTNNYVESHIVYPRIWYINDDFISEDDKAGLSEMIREGVTSIKHPDKLQIAIYMGVVPTFTESMPSSDFSPRSNVYRCAQAKTIKRLGGEFYNWACIWPDNDSLALKGDEGLVNRFYNGNIHVDTANEFVISFRSTNLFLDAKEVFVIDNEKFYCKQLKYVGDADGMSEIVEGVFYKIK